MFCLFLGLFCLWLRYEPTEDDAGYFLFVDSLVFGLIVILTFLN